MSSRVAKALMVGNSFSGAPRLGGWLEKRGCCCQVAASYQEAHALLASCQFDLVLCQTSLPDGSAYRLIPRLAGSPIGLFYCFTVEDSCWWLPALVQGQNCWGSPAQRPREFARVLEELLNELTSVASPPSQAGTAAKEPTVVVPQRTRNKSRLQVRKEPSPAVPTR